MRGKLPTRTSPQPVATYPRRALSLVNWFVVHHSGSGLARPTVQDIAAFQVGPHAQAEFPAIAYTMYAEADGHLIVCHDLETVTWANGDNSPTSIAGVGIYNWRTVSICLSGQDGTVAQLATVLRAWHTLSYVDVLNRQAALALRGHREVTGPQDTECPGNFTMSWIEGVR